MNEAICRTGVARIVLVLLSFLTLSSLAQDTIRISINGHAVHTQVIQPTIIRDTVYLTKPEDPTEPTPVPVTRVEAEDYAEMHGVEAEGSVVGFIQPGDWMKYENVSTASSLTFRFSNAVAAAGRKMQVRKEGLTGTVIAEWLHETTGGWNSFKEVTIPVSEQFTGDIYLTFTGTDGWVFNLDWLEFSEEKPQEPTEPEEPTNQGKVYRVSPTGTGDCISSACTFEKVATVAKPPATVVAQPGIYVINAYLKWPAGVSLKGSGESTILKLHSSKKRSLVADLFQTRSQNLALFNMRSPSTTPFTFSDFVVDGEKPTGSHTQNSLCMSAVFNLQGVDNFTLHNVKVKDVGHWVIWLHDCDNVKILGSDFRNASRGRVASGDQAWTYGTGMIQLYRGMNLEVGNCHFEQDWGGPYLQAVNGYWNMNHFRSNTHNEITNARIHHNFGTQADKAAWDVPGQNAPANAISFEFLRARCVNCEIDNNDIDGNISIVQRVFDDGYATHPFKNAVGGSFKSWDIHDNKFMMRRRSSTQYAIELSANDVYFHGNYIEANNAIVDFGVGVPSKNMNFYDNEIHAVRDVIINISGWQDVKFQNNDVHWQSGALVSFAGRSDYPSSRHIGTPAVAQSSDWLIHDNRCKAVNGYVAGRNQTKHNVSAATIIVRDNVLDGCNRTNTPVSMINNR